MRERDNDSRARLPILGKEEAGRATALFRRPGMVWVLLEVVQVPMLASGRHMERKDRQGAALHRWQALLGPVRLLE